MSTMAKINPRIIVQSDWDHILRKNAGKAWISYKTKGEKGVHSELHSIITSRSVHVSASDGFNVEDIAAKNLTVTYSKDEDLIRTRFQAPIITFSSVHNANKAVIGLDVTNGGLAITSDTEGKVKIWSNNNGEIRRELVGHLGDVYTCKFFPSGIVALTGGADMQLKVWSVETGQCAASMIGHKAGICDTAIVERGRNVVSASRDGTVKLWDVGQQSCLYTYEQLGGVVNSCSLGTNPSSQKHTVLPEDREVLTEGKILLCGVENGSMHAFSLRDRSKLFTLECESAVNCCCFVSPTVVACGTQDSHIHLVDIRQPGVPLLNIEESRSAILSMYPFQQGCFISSGDGSCCLLNEDMSVSLELTGSDCDPVYRVVGTAQAVYTSCRDGTVRRYYMS